MIWKLLRYCRGYVRLEITGVSLERFLNLCRARNVELWDIRRPSPDRMCLSVPAAGWREIEPICHRTMCEAAVVGRRGLALALRPFAGRYFLLPAACCCLLLSLLSTRILWRVTIDGCRRIPELEIYSQLRGLGLETGRPLSAIDGEHIRRELMTLRDDLAYVTINLRGTEAHVIITEKDMTQQITPRVGPCDLICDKAGIIEDIQVLSGVQEAFRGDTVIPGDRLASGTVTSSQGEVRRVEAAANVTLRTWRTVSAALPAEIRGLTENGNTVSRWSLVIGRRRCMLPLIEKNDYACYYKTMETVAFSLGEGYFFPITLVKETWHECTAQPLPLSETACGDLLHARCRAILDSVCLPDGVSETGFFLKFGPDGICGTLEAECLEAAGVQRPLTTGGAAVPAP